MKHYFILATRESARLKAEDPDFNTSGSESFKGRGFRKKKTKKYIYPEEAFSRESSDSEVITPPPTPSNRDLILIEVPPEPVLNTDTTQHEAKQNSKEVTNGKYDVTELDFIFQEGRHCILKNLFKNN